MAVRYRRQGLGRELSLVFGGDLSLGGLIDQSLPNMVPDPLAMKGMRLAKKQHPVLTRGMRTSEVWGDCVGDLQANITAMSLTSPLTLHGQRSRTSGGGTKREAQRSHPLNVEALVDANVDFVSLANGHSMDFQEEGLLDTWEALETAGVAHAGSGEVRERSLRPALLRSVPRSARTLPLVVVGRSLMNPVRRRRIFRSPLML